MKTSEAIAAIEKSHGNVSQAAKALGISRQYLHRYVNKHSTVHEALSEARATVCDFAEGKLLEAMHNGEGWAIMFYLRTQGRSRGYGNVIVVEPSIEGVMRALENMTDEELAELTKRVRNNSR